MAMTGKRRSGCRAAFTLVELLIAMVIFAVALTAIYTSYLTQNLRAGMYHLERELRMTGFDPNRTAGAGFIIADNNELQITSDLNSNGRVVDSAGDSGERIRYVLSGGSLIRQVWGSPLHLSTLAEDIEVLDFVYLDEDNNALNPNLADVAAANLADIRSVQVTMVARVDRGDGDYRNNNTYRNQQGVVILPAQNDTVRRRILTSTIRCRNMGL
jgi:type IV pilus assembly protein PilW